MTNSLSKSIPLRDYSVKDWEAVLEHGCYRGYNINKIAKSVKSGDFSKVIFDTQTNELSLQSEDNVKLKLQKIIKCKSPWSFSRFIYWVKTKIFGKNTYKHRDKITRAAISNCNGSIEPRGEPHFPFNSS